MLEAVKQNLGDPPAGRAGYYTSPNGNSSAPAALAAGVLLLN